MTKDIAKSKNGIKCCKTRNRRLQSIFEFYSREAQQQKRRTRKRRTKIHHQMHCGSRVRFASMFSLMFLLFSLFAIDVAKGNNNGGSTGRTHHNYNHPYNIENNENPYTILGVSKDAKQDEIRQQYRKLCLKYHPDKNVHLPTSERRRCEEIFKRVQKANSQIGDQESRRQYDASATLFSNSFFSQQQQHPSSPFSNPYFRQTYSSSNPFFSGNTRVFTMNDLFSGIFGSGNGVSSDGNKSFFFGNNGNRNTMNQNQNPSSSVVDNNLPKSKYVQKIKVPLSTLYNGCDNIQAKIKDNVFKRYCAAFRGNMIYMLFYQSVLFSLPILRISRLLSLVVGVMLIHVSLPRLPEEDYHNNISILPGYKGGTKFIYHNIQSEQQQRPQPDYFFQGRGGGSTSFSSIDVIFVIEEEKHKYYSRYGNNLYTEISITREQAKTGCKVDIQPLENINIQSSLSSESPPSQTQLPRRILLRPNKIKESGDIIVLKGRGWPIRKKRKNTREGETEEQQFGDLVVKFVIRKNWWWNSYPDDHIIQRRFTPRIGNKSKKSSAGRSRRRRNGRRKK